MQEEEAAPCGCSDSQSSGSSSPRGPKGGGTLKTCAICIEDYRCVPAHARPRSPSWTQWFAAVSSSRSSSGRKGRGAPTDLRRLDRGPPGSQTQNLLTRLWRSLVVAWRARLFVLGLLKAIAPVRAACAACIEDRA